MTFDCYDYRQVIGKSVFFRFNDHLYILILKRISVANDVQCGKNNLKTIMPNANWRHLKDHKKMESHHLIQNPSSHK